MYLDDLGGIRGAICRANSSSESREPLVQCTSFTLVQEIVRALVASMLGIVHISPNPEGGMVTAHLHGHLFGVLLDALSS